MSLVYTRGIPVSWFAAELGNRQHAFPGAPLQSAKQNPSKKIPAPNRHLSRPIGRNCLCRRRLAADVAAPRPSGPGFLF